jgi:hypothetical protein
MKTRSSTELDLANMAAQQALAKKSKTDNASKPKTIKEEEKTKGCIKCDPETRHYKQPKVIHETHIWIPASSEIVHCHEPLIM